MLTLTENAIKKVKEYIAADAALTGKHLRIFVEKGGCSGFQYGMTFDDSKADDQIVKAGDVNILVDAESAQHLNEVKIDYVESLTGAGFSITNPNAKSSCGCGNSFQV